MNPLASNFGSPPPFSLKSTNMRTIKGTFSNLLCTIGYAGLCVGVSVLT